MRACENSTPLERAQYLNEDAPALEQTHQQAAVQGQTAPTLNARSHFVCYVNKDGNLWELDGRRATPINKGKMESDNLGIEVSKVIKKYIEMDDGEIKFSVMALAPNALDDY